MSQGLSRIGLKDTIAALRQELMESIIDSQGKQLRFEIGEVMVEFHVEVEHNKEGKGGIKFWVVELGGGGGVKDKAIHKVTIPLKPVRPDGGSVFTGNEEIPN